MRKIASAFIFAVLAWFSGSALAFDACNPSSPTVPCTYNNTDFDTVMYNNNIKAFYIAALYIVDHSVNLDPDVNDVWKPSGSPCPGVVWIYGTPYGFCGAAVNKAAAGYGWLGTGITYPGYFRYPTSFTTSNADGWNRKANSFGSLNGSSIPHAGEDWNNGTSCDDRGLPLYAIGAGTVKEITPGNSSDGWGKTILIQHDAPSGTYFLSGRGELLTTIWSMYAHVLKTGQTGYNSNLEMQAADEAPIGKGDPVGQVGDADGQYSGACHLHFEIFTSLPGSGVGEYRDNPYDWAMLAYRTDPSELIENGLYQASSIDSFSITVHPYECSGAFKLDAATPNCDGTTDTSGNWTRRGAGVSPELGANGIIFSKTANVSGNATWTPNLPKDGQYKVLVYVPQNYATATSAVYTVTSNGNSSSPVTVNQSAYSSAWVDIGTYQLHKTGSPNVVLTGNTGESNKVVAADAVRFQFIAP